MENVTDRVYREHAESLKVGDTVCYSARFLRSTGFYTGAAPFREGRIIAENVDGMSHWVSVKWDTLETTTVNRFNLWRLGEKHKEPR